MSERSQAEYLKRGDHLPAPLKDFHDQKDVFKSLHEWIGEDNLGISWVEGHCYVVDNFLRFMAAHGWTMQRSRAYVQFASLDATIKTRRDKEVEQLRELFTRRPERDSDGSPQGQNAERSDREATTARAEGIAQEGPR